MTFFCLGDLMVDVVARLFGPLAEGSDSPGVISYVGGGSAANTAAWLSRVGESTTFIGAIGDDPAGQLQAESLHRLGVDVRFRVDRTRPTGTCLVLVAPSGERTMVPDPGANLSLLEHDVPTDEFRAGDHLHVSGYTLLRDSRDAALHAMAAAGSVGMSVTVGAASAAPLEQLGAREFLRMVPDQALLFANEKEAAVLVGGPAGRGRARAEVGGRRPRGRGHLGLGHRRLEQRRGERGDGRRAARPSRARHDRCGRRLRGRVPGGAGPCGHARGLSARRPRPGRRRVPHDRRSTRPPLSRGLSSPAG